MNSLNVLDFNEIMYWSKDFYIFRMNLKTTLYVLVAAIFQTNSTSCYGECQTINIKTSYLTKWFISRFLV